MRSKAVIESLRERKLKTQKINRRALRGAADPISFEGIQALQVDGLLSIEVFKENIGSIFPFILEKVSEGIKIQAIERMIGMNHRSLQQFIMRNSRIKEQIKKARSIRTDDIQLRALLD